MTEPDHPRTNVYVDGFNLYYGALKGTPYKWLDVATLCQRLLPAARIQRIRYFTALVHDRAHDPGESTRQQAYLRALETIPNLTIHLGTFRQHAVRMPLATPPPNGPRTVSVIKTEEKGSDVNLAAHLLLDCFRGDFAQAVVVSNDSDLVEPVRMVVQELRVPVGLLNPYPKPARDLHRVATFYKPIRRGVVADSQFPTLLADSRGTIHKPPGW
jgi:hypothetical protein